MKKEQIVVGLSQEEVEVRKTAGLTNKAVEAPS